MPFPLPKFLDSNDELPDLVFGYASVKSQGGKSCFEMKALPESVESFYGKREDHKLAEKALASMGFQVTAGSRLGVAISGPPGAWEELTGGTLVCKERLVVADSATERYVTHLDIIGAKQPKSFGCGVPKATGTGIEAVVVESPRSTAAVFPSPTPPSPPGFFLRVPDDVATILNASAPHSRGFRGQGVAVSMVDTGQFAHPFFTAHSYRVRQPIAVVPGTSRAKDPIGHGTGESANIFALAPDCELQSFRASNSRGALVAAIAGFMKAKALNPKVLTNSWGGEISPSALSDADKTWSLEIQDAVEQGIFVVFSAGNGQFSLEPQVPQVFAAGGVFVDAAHNLRASDYASGYTSPFFTGRIVPDACGLVGMQPRAMYIMLPVPPGSQLDTEMSNFDEQGNAGDGTPPGDGWGRFSGTSAAAPQVAGAAATILSAKPGLTPGQIKQALVSTATDVVVGHSFPQIFNSPAGPGVDAATGAGLINVAAAVQFAIDNF